MIFLGKCVQQHCQAAMDATSAQVKATEELTRAAINDFTAKRITRAQLKANLVRMQRDLQKTEETLELNKCQIQNCNKALIEVLKTSVDLIDYKCKDGSKKACTNGKIAGELVRNKKKITLAELQLALKHIMDGA